MPTLFLSSSAGVVKAAEGKHSAKMEDRSAGLPQDAAGPNPCVKPPLGFLIW